MIDAAFDKENVASSPSDGRVAKKLRTEVVPAVEETKAAKTADLRVTSLASLESLKDLLASPPLTSGGCDSIIVLLHGDGQLERVLDDVHRSTEATRVPIFTINAIGPSWSQAEALEVLTSISQIPSQSHEDDHNSKPPSALPLLFLFSNFNSSVSGKVLELVAVKEVENNLHIHSQSLLQPAFTVEHLEERITAALRVESGNTASFTLLYFGASWCPPCMNILKALPSLLAVGQRPSSIKTCIKLDMDLAQPVFDLFAVETIPTFIVLDNNKLANPSGGLKFAADNGSSALREGAVCGRIQNSQSATVEAFLQKTCGTLSFTLDDEDF